eukprot:Hpha_TRINITY_DN16147_c2_g1::TRINITY_DN16147_c2_g1_i3::g.6143::m.6143
MFKVMQKSKIRDGWGERIKREEKMQTNSGRFTTAGTGVRFPWGVGGKRRHAAARSGRGGGWCRAEGGQRGDVSSITRGALWGLTPRWCRPLVRQPQLQLPVPDRMSAAVVCTHGDAPERRVPPACPERYGASRVRLRELPTGSGAGRRRLCRGPGPAPAEAASERAGEEERRGGAVGLGRVGTREQVARASPGGGAQRPGGGAPGPRGESPGPGKGAPGRGGGTPGPGGGARQPVVVPGLGTKAAAGQGRVRSSGGGYHEPPSGPGRLGKCNRRGGRCRLRRRARPCQWGTPPSRGTRPLSPVP